MKKTSLAVQQLSETGKIRYCKDRITKIADMEKEVKNKYSLYEYKPFRIVKKFPVEISYSLIDNFFVYNPFLYPSEKMI